MSHSKNYVKVGETIHSRMEKVNSELVALTYGTFVIQLLKDNEEVHVVNVQLEKIGSNIGSRLVEEFLAKSSLAPCSDFKDIIEVLCKVGFKMFLGITADSKDWSADGTSCSIVFSDNPLNDFVELPPSMIGTLRYSNIICGAIKGALDQLLMRVSCEYVKDVLYGDPANEIHIELKEVLREEFVEDEDPEAKLT